jgi:SAM-dependent methyltransferase
MRIQPYSFLLEESKIPIYERINSGLSGGLRSNGQNTKILSLADLKSTSARLDAISTYEPDYVIITTPFGELNSFIFDKGVFFYELIHSQLIFLHYENCYSTLSSLEEITGKIDSYVRTNDISHHFCIEHRNYLDLKELGIDRVHQFNHATELAGNFKGGPTSPMDVSFVGHLLPPNSFDLQYFHQAHNLYTDFWSRVSNLSYHLEPRAHLYAKKFSAKTASITHYQAFKYFYLSGAHWLSPHFRGAVLETIQKFKIDIFGGDPAYLHGIKIVQRINRPYTEYHHPTSTLNDLCKVYSSSRINLNITSLQFDQAVINRVLDAGACGGFVLTDAKRSLSSLTSVAKEITYSSPEELNHKLEYYLHVDHENEREEIADVLRRDIVTNGSYPLVTQLILNHIHDPIDMKPAAIKIDLGCGNLKPNGFLGVDILSSPSVDLTADLTNRFPFATSSVDFIRAHDIIEHLPDKIHTMNEIWRVCRPGALVDIRVPSTDGRGSFQDPTHISYWNRNSFFYYCQEYPEYLSLCKSYGFIGEFSLIELRDVKSGDEVVHVEASLIAIKASLPRQNESPKLQQYDLRAYNYLVELNWDDELEVLMSDLVNVVTFFAKHPSGRYVTLVLKPVEPQLEDIQLAITAMMMEQLLNGSILDLESSPGIALLETDDFQEIKSHIKSSLIPSHLNRKTLLDYLAA